MYICNNKYLCIYVIIIKENRTNLRGSEEIVGIVVGGAHGKSWRKEKEARKCNYILI